MCQNRVFLDTNIVIDILDTKRPLHNKASRLIEFLTLRKFEIAISEDMLSTIFYIVKDKKAVLRFLKNIINRWLILPYGADVIRKAIDTAYDNELDLEDVLQCVCAKENRCGYFITSDKKFFTCGIDIVTYDEFFDIINL